MEFRIADTFTDSLARPSLLLCFVGHHDKAYDWAERRKLEITCLSLAWSRFPSFWTT